MCEKIGNTSWKLFCLEHDLDKNNGQLQNVSHCHGTCDAIFYESRSRRYTPRAIFVDLDHTPLIGNKYLSNAI